MDIQTLDFQNSHEWHHWLLQNHGKEKEAWLIFYKKNSGKTGISYDEALEEALCFGWIDGKLKSIDDEKYMIRHSPRKDRSVWSKINKEKAELLILQGRMTNAGLAKIEEAKKNGLWDRAYTSRKGDEMPSALEAALQEDKQAWTNFNNFANSYRNNYIFWINASKTTETHGKRVSVVVERARLNKKPGEP
jgi:uncharacterized protein YdeI (YjbR/CyaY-like superfamily)